MCKLADGCNCPLGGCEECDIRADGPVCLKCQADRFLSVGRCRRRLLWRGANANEDGEKCRWDDEQNCHSCVFTGGPAKLTKMCTRCKNSM